MFDRISKPQVSLRKDVYALRSGGPRTEEGKAASSRNSLAHGLTAKQVVIPGENQSDFDELHHNLLHDRKPEGELEIQLTAEIAACFWRLARARQHESDILRRHGLYDENAPRLTLVIRYIGSIERQLNRTIARLEHAQNERRKASAPSVSLPSSEQPPSEQPQPAPKVMVAGAGIGPSFESAPAHQFVSSNVHNSFATPEDPRYGDPSFTSTPRPVTRKTGS
jgi:hypothetical protein